MNWNRKVLMTAILAVMVFSMVNGQVRDRVKTLKVAFITERLSLTSSEAQNFWPIYNEHEKKLEQIRIKERTRFRGQMADLMSISDQEASNLLSDYMALQKEKVAEQDEFVRQLKGVISSKKIILLLKTEEDFKKRLLQQYRKRRNGG
ncbi:MAG: hypothetical protein ED555_09850 [Allomuricauda sp.]|nr:MAG: hypothetical protein ED555_09850 [Allomuricauda sp.]